MSSNPADVPPGTRRMPARDIPIPHSLSPQAQAMMAVPLPPADSYPETSDPDIWRTYVEEADGRLAPMLAMMNTADGAQVEERTIDGARVFVATPDRARFDDRFLYLDIHGGGLVMGGGALCRGFAQVTAARVGAKVYSVDYRMPPDHPYPAALDDCVGVYRALLERHDPKRIIIGGSSAGGNLAAATILRARDEGLALPAGAVLMTPELDLTESGDSFQTNLGLDALLVHSLMPANLLYAGGADLKDPYLSPLFGDFSKGFPPTLLSAGTRDLFLSNAVRMFWALRRYDIPATLLIDEAGSHGGFFGCPEAEQVAREVSAFISARWGD